MKPSKFKESNAVFVKDQPEYLPLPVWKGEDGTVISCWKLNLRERIKFFLTGKIWLWMLTFNHPLQPQRLDVDYPFKKS